MYVLCIYAHNSVSLCFPETCFIDQGDLEPRDLSASASLELGLKAWATIPCFRTFVCLFVATGFLCTDLAALELAL